MIPVEKQSEPDSFNVRVREPGLAFLKQCSSPTSRQFQNHDYWRRCGRDLYLAYGAICAYSCHWIPSDTGSDTVEHFVPKSVDPTQAYEWDNYRLVCGRLNGRKGNNVTFGFLESHAPFIAAELNRQNLVDSISSVMGLA